MAGGAALTSNPAPSYGAALGASGLNAFPTKTSNTKKPMNRSTKRSMRPTSRSSKKR